MFDHLTNCDPYRDMLFAEINGEPAAYSRVFWQDDQDGPRFCICLGFAVPAWRRQEAPLPLGEESQFSQMLRLLPARSHDRDPRRTQAAGQGHVAPAPRTHNEWSARIALPHNPGGPLSRSSSGSRQGRHGQSCILRPRRSASASSTASCQPLRTGPSTPNRSMCGLMSSSGVPSSTSTSVM